MNAQNPHFILLEKLRREIEGEVLADPVSLGIYATDASMYQIAPLAVVLPRDRTDALRAVRIAAEAGAPILPRGGGTSLTGQTVNRAVVLDFSKYMNRLLELNVAERWARVEPGLVRDELNALLAPHRLQFAPDPATSNRANVGGMISNNAAGMRSIQYGMTIDHVLGLDLALSNGEVLNLGWIDEDAYAAKCKNGGREGEIYRTFEKIIGEHREEIRERYPKVKRRSGGYPFDAFVGNKPWNMAKLVCGSEGTFGTLLEARVNLEPIPKHSGLILAHYASMDECLRSVACIVEQGPSAVELMDGLIVRLARQNIMTRETCAMIEGEPEAVLTIEAQADTKEEVAAKLAAIQSTLRKCGAGYALPILLDPGDIRAAWIMRNNALGLMSTVKGKRRPIPYIEDAAVPLENLPDYIAEVVEVCRRRGQPVSLFAHASVGLLHVRPMHDLLVASDRASLTQIQDEVFALVMKYKGAWSGEHGDGIVRGGYNERFFGPRIYEAFRAIKRAFDPDCLMNPGKIVDTMPNLENLRAVAAARQPFDGRTMFHYRADGGMMRAVNLCNGVGECRKTLHGTMCPSYIATRDEEHSTRGRANALRLAMSGQMGSEGLADEGLHEALDLCISCKGCKNECPNNVDMARLKAEALHYKYLRKAPRLRDRMFATASRTAALSTGWRAPMVNWLMKQGWMRGAMDLLLGIDCRRPLPEYARETLTDWFDARQGERLRNTNGAGGNRAGGNSKKQRRVALFNDTYMECYEPAVGRAAVRVLEAAGFEVVLANAGDSQRAAISKGMLTAAKREGEAVLRALDAFAKESVPILVCEPSCWSALMDDLPDLIDDAELGRRVGGAAMMIDDFLASEAKAGRLKLPWVKDTTSPAILVHGHCHQKALGSIKTTLALLREIPGASVRETGAGCCGMAGSFGYEKEHYEVSVKIAEDRLLPALRSSPAEEWVVANGFSCRHQIADLAGRRAMHAVEAIAAAIAAE